MGLIKPPERGEITQSSSRDSDPFNPSADINTQARHLARLVFLSYRFSQGGVGLQQRLLAYMEDKFHPNMFNAETEVYHTMKYVLERMVQSYFMNERIHPPIPYDTQPKPSHTYRNASIVAEDVGAVLGNFRTRDTLHLFPCTPVDIAHGMLAMDYDYVTRPGGRADGSEFSGRAGDFPRDPYESKYLKHSVVGATTGSFEYDHLFTEIGSPAVVSELDNVGRAQLVTLVDLHMEHCREPDELTAVQDFRASLLTGR